MLFHVFEYLPQQLKESLVQLLAEGNFKSLSSMAARRGLRAQTRSDFAGSMLKRQRQIILARLPKSKSPNTRTKPKWRDAATLKNFAQLVNSRKLLAETIKRVYDQADGAFGWRNDLQSDGDYQLLKAAAPKKPLDWALKRVAAGGEKRDRQPLALACEMARQELNLDPQQPQTLRTYYLKGKALLKKPKA